MPQLPGDGQPAFFVGQADARLRPLEFAPAATAGAPFQLQSPPAPSPTQVDTPAWPINSVGESLLARTSNNERIIGRSTER